MTEAASDCAELALPLHHDLVQGRSGGAPMFGHRPVGWGRHASAVFGAAFVNSGVQTVLGMLATLTAMRMAGASLGQHPILATAIGTLMLWVSSFVVALAFVALVFTMARGVLTLARCNFGGVYVALGLIMGVMEASIVGAFKGAMSPRDFLFGATTGVLSGFVYWLIASRDGKTVAAEPRVRTAEAIPQARLRPAADARIPHR